MNRAFTLTYSAILSLAFGTTVHGQTPTTGPIKGAPLSAATVQPIQIVRSPPTLQLRPAAPTNRVLSTVRLNQILLGPKIGAIPSRLPPGPPGKQALIVILENGGVMQSNAEFRDALDVNFRTASCGTLEFELKAGEDIAGLIGRVAAWLLGNAVCVDPRNWSIKTFNPYEWLNAMTDQAIENAVKAQNSLVNTQSRYDVVIVMEDANATPPHVLSIIRQYAPTHVLDIHVLTHGRSEVFGGYNGAPFTDSTFFSKLRADRAQGKPLYIRSVYQMNCVSGTLKDNWLQLGAVVANGTQSTYNNGMSHQYFHFLQRWLNGAGMRDASQGSWEDAAAYTRPVYVMIGIGDWINKSLLIASGSNTDAKVTTSL